MILNSYERMVARRYLLPGKGEGFIFLVASISLIAVALGVAALIIVMSVMNGFRAELFDKITGLNGHAIVQGYEGRLQDWQQMASTKGATNLSTGVQAAKPKMQAADGKLLSTVDTVRNQVKARPGGTLEQRLARATEFARRMNAAYKGQ